MKESEEKKAFSELEQKISAAKKQQSQVSSRMAKDNSPTRALVEMVAGAVVGVLMGWQLDTWFETKPLFFIIGFFFGVAAGVFNIYKLATKGDTVEKLKPKLAEDKKTDTPDEM